MKPHYSRSPAVSCKLSKCHWHSVKIRWTEQIFLPTRSQQQQQQQQDKVQSTTLLTTLTFDPGRTPFTANHYSQWSHKDPTRRDAHTSAPPPPTVSQKRWGFFSLIISSSYTDVQLQLFHCIQHESVTNEVLGCWSRQVEALSFQLQVFWSRSPHTETSPTLKTKTLHFEEKKIPPCFWNKQQHFFQLASEAGWVWSNFTLTRV